MTFIKSRLPGGAVFAAGAVLALVASGGNSAIAQVLNPPQIGNTPNCNFAQRGGINNLNTVAAPAAAVSGAIAGAVGNINTIFLGQQGSAFVSAPTNPAPNQPGGGLWGRALGGEVTLDSHVSFERHRCRAGQPGGNHQHHDELQQ